MKKTALLWGALLAAFALQACNNSEDSVKTDPAASETPSDTNLAGDTQWKTPDGRNIVAEGELSLGGDGQIMVQSAYTNPGTGWTGNGIGITDATLCGDGRDACTAACPEPCLAPGYPSGCGPCASRGTWAAGIITANLTLNNTTAGGNYGVCTLQDKTVCSTTTPGECSPGIPVVGSVICNGNPVTSGGTLADSNPENTIPAGIMAGFCQDGVTACAAAQSNGGGSSVTCGGLGTCSDSPAYCGPGVNMVINNLVGSDDDVSACGNPLTATCVPSGPMIGDGRCWSGCGTCDNGRPFNCAAFTYTGSNTNGGGGDLKCTGGPYSMSGAEIGGDTIVIGTVATGGSAPFTFLLNSSDSSFCVHSFVVSDDPYGDEAGQGCTATCGDGVIATTNGETCEPTNNPADMLPPYTHLGCLVDGEQCSTCNTCFIPVATCGNGLPDLGEGCDTGGANGSTTCGCQLNCQFAAAAAACGGAPGTCEIQDTCDGAGACTDNAFAAAGTACGSGAVTACDLADTCAGGSGTCNANNVANGTACGGAPGTCEVQDSCNAGVCADNGFAAGGTACGSGAVTACDLADTCAGGSGTCNANNVADTTPCDNGANEPDADICLTGVCVDPTPVCGNTLVQAGEQCDDGNLVNGDCCSSTCQFEAAGLACGSGASSTCDNPDTCNGAGTCNVNNMANGTNCGVPGTCEIQDTCTAGACQDNGFSAAGTACGSNSDTSCDNPDTCAGGSGTCNANNEADGFVCNPSAQFGCVLADTCTAGVCIDNGNAADTTPCDNTAGTGPPDECQTGVCVDLIVGTVVTTVVPIKGTSADTYTSAGSDGDYNTGMTTGSGAIEWYTSLPNDPNVTNYGTDKVWADVSFSAALTGGNVVSCTINPGAIPADVSDCGAGDLTCKVFGSHPELTAVVSDIQSNNAVPTGSFPDETATALAISIGCQVDATLAVVASGEVAMGTVGVPDAKLAPGAGGVFGAQVIYYCADGATQDCTDLNSGGDATIGIRANLAVLHFNPAIFAVAGSTATTVRANPANAYGHPQNSGICAGQVNTAITSCVSVAAGAAGVTGPAVGSACQGWMVGHIATCNLSYGAQAAGTYTVIDTTSIAADFLYYLNGGMGLPIRGLDAAFNPLPTANVSAQIIFNP